MSWKPIVVGVDATPAAAGAVVFAGKLARAVGVECHLVHVARGTWLTGDGPERAVAYRAAALHAVREEIEAALVAGGVSPAFARQLDVRTGWPPAILDGVVRDVGAELLVLGAKHHNAVG